MWIPMILTASLSAIFTLVGAILVYWIIFRRFLDKELERQADLFEVRLREEFEKAGEALVPEFRRELEEAFRSAGEELIPEFSAELEKAFLRAASELLPEFREEVRKGFKEAMVGAVSGDIVPSAAQKMAERLKNMVTGK